ncbi:polysaccharide pyruvyl transferase family protein [Marinobacter sp. SBS5]|uniref:polysaccharide pyruvyl transferase family protein n=1 Tax=Marinobacter sp. SBS5 TaxID=3401754 RepID=UPI003AAB79B0
MKKVAILNFQYTTKNYGAVLQAAALEHTCRKLGHEAWHLDYIGKPRFSLKSEVGQLLRKLGLRRTPKAQRVANKKTFERFRNGFIKRTQRIQSPREFSAIASEFDAAIVGSDQVWRPAFAIDALAFFLGYVPQGIDRIAYAASFGTASWEQIENTVLTEAVRRELKLFKAISCREDSGVEICKDVFGVEAAHVLDPLLLVDGQFFHNILGKSSRKSSANLIYYKLDSSPEFVQDLEVISSDFGSDAVNIYFKNSNVLAFNEVPDWLTMILDAEVVITDSFHCICLALRFGKEVIFCPNEKRGRTRLDSLFRMFDIELEQLAIDLKTPMFKLVGHGDINAILEKQRLKSIEFLSEALNG